MIDKKYKLVPVEPTETKQQAGQELVGRFGGQFGVEDDGSMWVKIRLHQEAPVPACGALLYTSPPEAPDVSGLVEACQELLNAWDACENPLDGVAVDARAALSAHREAKP